MIQFLISLFLLQNSPLLDAHKMQELRDKLAARIVEVDVKLPPLGGTDPTFTRNMQGQAVCVRDAAGKARILTSKFLVEGALEVRVRTGKHPEWVDANVASTDEELAVAFLAPKGEVKIPCPETKLAPSNLAAPDVFVFSIDNPATLPNLFWGKVLFNAEPPLADFLLTSTGLPIGYPLFSMEGDLLALNVRRYTPTSPNHLAVSCAQLRRFFKSKDKKEEDPR